MTGLHSRALLGLAHACKWVGPGGIVLVSGVAAVWLVIVGVIVLAVPAPGHAALPSSSYADGQLAHLDGSQGTPLRIPLEVSTFKDLYQALWADNGLAINEVLSRAGWIHALDGQAVRIMDVYEDGVQVELLDGPSAGVQGWVMLHQLRP
jgi:hypothetical protein